VPVPIDATETGSPGWWMNRLFRKLERDQKRFQVLEDYYSGRPRLAWGSEQVRSRFYRFQNMSRTNFAALIVQAPCERTGLRAVSTAVDADVDGDARAWELVTANDLDVSIQDVASMSRKFGRSYLAAAMPEEPGGYAVITAEDPRQMITEADPVRPRRVRAAFKLFHDAEAEVDVAILWLPGQKWVATRPRKAVMTTQRSRSGGVLGVDEPPRVAFSAAAFEMAPLRPAGDASDGFFSEVYATKDIPVEPVFNREGLGEFELHTDLIDRINHMILQRIVIATLQAFRQRALKQSGTPGVPALPEYDESGQKVDYTDLFEAGPDATWILPPGAEIWESGQVDLQGILSAVKDDVLHLSAVTRTPMSMFTPDAATQTAEGAQLMREGLVFNVEHWNRSAGRSLARILALGFAFMGDDARADAAKMSVSWVPAERYSLAEKGSAASQAGQSLTWEQQQEFIWQMDPQDIASAKAQRADDLVLAQQMASLAANPAGARTSAQPAA
jgi:hypothetical protein